MTVHALALRSATLVCLGLFAFEAHAEVGSSPFDPAVEFRPEEVPVETGFIPNSGPIRLNLTMTPYQDVAIEMHGDADYDFDAQQIRFDGEELGGTFTNTLGADVTAIIQITPLGAEFEVGIWSIDQVSSADFTPYVLDGADPRPVHVAEMLGPYNLVSTDFTVPGTDVPGTLDIDFHVDIPGLDYRSERIQITDTIDSAVPSLLALYVEEDSLLDLTLPNPQSGQTSTVWAELHGLFDSRISLVFTATITVVLFDQPVTVGPFELRADFPLREDLPVVFPPLELNYNVPKAPVPVEPEPPVDDDDDDDSAASDADGDTQAGTTGLPDDDTTGGFDTDGGPGLDIGEGDTGCGCTAGGSPTPGVLMLAGLGLLGLTRRRRD